MVEFEQDNSASPEGDPPLETEANVVDDYEDDAWREEVPSISFHALMGHVVSSTLKLIGSINGQEILILVDGGSTNNFIQSCLAAHLKLVVQSSSHRSITVGNGKVLTCGGEYSVVPLKVGDTIFSVDLILLPIYGANYVLGVQWLLQVGPMVFDYRNLLMEFNFKGIRVRLHGLTQSQSHLVRLTSFRKTNPDHAQLFQLTIESI